METNDKRIFFIQLMENFFDTEDLTLIADEAEANGISQSSAQLIYLKLILASLKNDGLIYSNNHGILSPKIIRTKIKFRENKPLQEELKTIDLTIQILQELDLITLTKDVIFVKNALTLAMNKQESSQKRLIDRRKNNLKRYEIELIQNNALTEEQKEEIMFETKLNDEWLPGLIYCGFAKSDEAIKYSNIFMINLDWCSHEEISQAMKLFVKRSLDTDYTKIEHKENYLDKTLSNIILDEIRAFDGIYDPIVELLNKQGKIDKSKDLKNYLGMLKRFERNGFSKTEIRESALHVLSILTNIDSIATFESQLEKHLVANSAKKGE